MPKVYVCLSVSYFKMAISGNQPLGRHVEIVLRMTSGALLSATLHRDGSTLILLLPVALGQSTRSDT